MEKMEKNETRQKILCIDDDEIQLELLSSMLRDKYEVITAKSGKEALDCFSQGLVPHLILLDIVMPQMDGWETFNKIRGVSLLQDVPIRFITAHTGPSIQQQALAIGADEYIEKPLQKNDLLKRIEKAIGGS